jgi:outer membrane protein assembly factor BamD
MPIASRRIGFLITLLLVLAAALPATRADLVWDAQSGWRIEGGAFASFTSTAEGRSAKALMDTGRRAEDAGKEGKALKNYKRVYKKFPSSIFAAEALFRTAKVNERNRQFTKAFGHLQQIINEHPSYERFNEVLGAQYRIAEKLAQGTRPRYFGLIPGFKQRTKGLEYYEQVVTNAPYSEYSPIALMNASAGYADTGDRDAAIDALDRMINNYPESFLTSDAYLRLAQAQASITQGPPYDQASTQLALTYFQDYLILYPGEADAATASEGFNDARTMLAESKMTMGEFYYKHRSNYKAAKVFYNEAITIHPDSSTADRARRLLAKIEEAETNPGGGESKDTHGGPRAKRFWIF